MNHGTRQLRLFISFNARVDKDDSLEAERHDRARFERLECRPNDIRVRREEVDEFARFRLGEEVGVDCGGLREGKEFGVLALDRGKTDVSVLEVRAGVSLEGKHTIPVEGVIIDTW